MFIEGSAVEDKDGNIYYVSYYNEKYEELFVIPKYIKNKKEYLKIKYFKNKFLKKFSNIYTYSNFLKRKTFILPIENVKVYYNPIARLKQIINEPKDKIENTVKELVELLIEFSNEEIENFGIGGSILVNKYTEDSDIDLIYYGKESKKVYEILKELRERKIFLPIKEKYLRKLYFERDLRKLLSYDKFKKIEKEKLTEGFYKEFLYSIKFVNRNIKEVEEVKGKFEGEVKVIDCSNSYLFPSEYIVKDEKNEEIYKLISFRIRFVEILKENEKVIISGRLEKVNNEKQIVINEREGYIKFLD